MKDPILITGISRSGTSLIAGIINICGAYSGNVAPPFKEITKSMFENIQIHNSVVSPYFKSIGADPMGQYPLPDVNTLQIPVNWRTRVQEIIKQEGYQGGEWMYKGTLMSLIHPIWHYAFPDAKWVIVRRRDEDIVNSCLHTGFMKAFNTPESWAAIGVTNKRDAWYWWIRQHNKRFVEMIEAGMNCKQVHPERMLRGDYSQINEMLEWLGLEWNSEIPLFIEQKFHKLRVKSKK